jgi:hypothetical protein
MAALHHTAIDMACVIRFTTALFDVTQERPNPINPIAGESLLLWLRERAQPALQVSPPEAEDWGWYAAVDWQARAYLLGASASDDEGAEREWVLQIEKQRSLKEKVMGREKMTADDACAQFFLRLLRAESGFSGVSVDPPVA